MSRAPVEFTPRVLTRAEVYGLVLPLWPYGEVDHAVDVAYLESGFDTGAWNTSGEDSRGLWQVYVKAWPQYAAYNLWDAQLNCWVAYQIFKAQGWRAWLNSATQLHLV